jgi:2-polyprenyl-3-methyl-5-hydroxy-6-metoxy-1,4-benzoquinol methylase
MTVRASRESGLDKAGRDHWDMIWQSSNRLLSAVDPRSFGLRNYIDKQFHSYFCSAFSTLNETPAHKKGLLEIGCAASRWLPYFAREFGFSVTGLDYSESGCETAQKILSREGVQGAVICADFFTPPSEMLAAFDVLVSFGVAEHFTDTATCLKAFGDFLKPSGIMITVVPNMVGLVGLLQKLLDSEVLAIHVPLDVPALQAAHESAGLAVKSCSYCGLAQLGGVFFDSIANKSTIVFRLLHILRALNTRALGLFDRIIPGLRGGRFLSGHVICVSVKP